jgi:hypothetical protein
MTSKRTAEDLWKQLVLEAGEEEIERAASVSVAQAKRELLRRASTYKPSAPGKRAARRARVTLPHAPGVPQPRIEPPHGSRAGPPRPSSFMGVGVGPAPIVVHIQPVCAVTGVCRFTQGGIADSLGHPHVQWTSRPMVLQEFPPPPEGAVFEHLGVSHGQ